MKCDRCNHDLVFVIEEIIEKGLILKKVKTSIKDYYCPRM
jgi:hypothetical protein